MIDEIERLERVWREAVAAATNAREEWNRLAIFASDKEVEWRTAKASAVMAHEWEGRIVTRAGRRKKPGSTNRRPVYVPITVRGVVETYRDQPLHGTGWSHSSLEIGDPLVRILTASGKPGKKLEKLFPFRVGSAPKIWTLEETA